MTGSRDMGEFGTLTLPTGGVDRPLVTFALFAYNQEAYIREAVEGAFAQTYSPLEIILSDDCSADRTFEIMQEMAAEYRGPHQVRVRRSEVNMGVMGHVLAVAHASNGKFFVVGAGDDVSFNNRTEISVKYLSQEEVFAFSSDDLIIDESGSVVNWDADRSSRRDEWHQRSKTWVHGASAAYRTSFLQTLPLPDEPIFYEDMVFNDMMRVYGKQSARLKEPLIKYRYHSENISNRLLREKSVEEVEGAMIKRWHRALSAKLYCLRLCCELRESGLSIDSTVVQNLSEEVRYLELISTWPNHNIRDKLEFLYRAFSRGSIKSSLIRVFGSKFFTHAMKYRKRKSGQ